jgi:D-alanyl-D-alanine carboxypeptidase
VGADPGQLVAPEAPTPAPTYGLEPAPERARVRLVRRPRAALLFDERTGQVLWSQHAGRTAPIASLTKMMTALVVAERTRPGDRVLITAAALRYRGSAVGLLPRGRRVPVEPLLYGLLLASGNDAARALAIHVGGSVPQFVALMNARARALGLRCTRFSSPDGYEDRGNHSCPPDLALLAHEVLAVPRLARIVRTWRAVLPFPIRDRRLFLYNHNPLLRLRYPGTTGVKTGYTRAAGPCLVATARRGRASLGVVLLDSPDPAGQARKLLDAGFRALRG